MMHFQMKDFDESSIARGNSGLVFKRIQSADKEIPGSKKTWINSFIHGAYMYT